MSDVFVSYARDDRTRVEQLAKALEARGFNVWWDPELLPGEQYAQKISKVLNDCKAVLVVWSNASAARPWVLDEASVGRDRGVLVPVLIEKVDAPLGFRQVQAEDLSDWPGATGEDNFERVVRALESLRGAPAGPKPASPFTGGHAEQPKQNFGFMRNNGGSAGAATAKKPNRMVMAGGALVLGVLATVALVQIFGGGGDKPGIEKPFGGSDAPGPTDNYGLTKKELATINGQPLIQLALQRTDIETIEAGAKQGDPTGELLLCLAYDWGEGLQADAASARSWCEAASDQGVAFATYLLQFYHLNGSGGYTPDPAKAQQFLLAAADGGDARAQFDLGNRYLNGVEGFNQDDNEALKYFRKAAEQGYQDAQFNVAWMYENGRGVSAPDYATAMLWYQKLADEGSAIGVRAVGWMHYNGWGVEKDWSKAIEYYEKASEMGDGNASNNLASMYENGEGVPRNLDEAVRYYRKASEQGYTQADDALRRLGFSN